MEKRNYHSIIKGNIKTIKFIRNEWKKIMLTLVLTAAGVFFIFPFVLTVSNSFMTEGEIKENYSVITQASVLGEQNPAGTQYVNLKLIPDEVSLKQLYNVMVKRNKFLIMFWNSMILVIPIAVGEIAVSLMAAYAFAKINFKFRERLFYIYIVTMLMPFQVTLVPNYIIVNKLGLNNSYMSIILPGIFSAFGVFLLRQFMTYIPNEYIEAARMDGASHIGIFLNIVIPMSKAGVAALAILIFIDNWNMVEQPLIFLQDTNKYPLSVFFSYINRGEIGIAFAASTLFMAPMVLMFLYWEEYLIQGIQLTGLKG